MKGSKTPVIVMILEKENNEKYFHYIKSKILRWCGDISLAIKIFRKKLFWLFEV